MRKEEAALGIVGICIRFWVFVMDSVVTRPFNYIILKNKIKSLRERVVSILVPMISKK